MALKIVTVFCLVLMAQGFESHQEKSIHEKSLPNKRLDPSARERSGSFFRNGLLKFSVKNNGKAQQKENSSSEEDGPDQNQVKTVQNLRSTDENQNCTVKPECKFDVISLSTLIFGITQDNRENCGKIREYIDNLRKCSNQTGGEGTTTTTTTTAATTTTTTTTSNTNATTTTTEKSDDLTAHKEISQKGTGDKTIIQYCIECVIRILESKEMSKTLENMETCKPWELPFHITSAITKVMSISIQCVFGVSVQTIQQDCTCKQNTSK